MDRHPWEHLVRCRTLQTTIQIVLGAAQMWPTLAETNRPARPKTCEIERRREDM